MTVTPVVAATALFSPWSWVIPLLGIIFAPILAYAVSRRTKSGRIGDTDAEILWKEAEKLRVVYQEEAVALREELAAVRAEANTIRTNTIALLEEAQQLRTENAHTSQLLSDARAELRSLRRQLAAANRKLEERRR